MLYLDKELVEKSKELGFNLSKTFENHLKNLINRNSPVLMQKYSNLSKFKSQMVGPPGFEPESIEPKSTSLDQASRRPHSVCGNSISHAPIKTLSTSQSKTSFAAFGECLAGMFFPCHSQRFAFAATPNRIN